jgi:hypothetical protein
MSDRLGRAVGIGGLGFALALTGCGPENTPQEQPTITATQDAAETPNVVVESPNNRPDMPILAYLPTWQNPRGSSTVETVKMLSDPANAGLLGELAVSFSSFKIEGGKPVLQNVPLTGPMRAIIKASGDASLTLAVGGWGDDETKDASHEVQSQGFKNAYEQPEAFADDVAAVVDDFNDKLAKAGIDKTVDGVHIDDETEGRNPDKFVNMLEKVDQALPVASSLSVEVPAYQDPGVDIAAISKVVDTISIMALDQNVGNGKADPVATPAWVRSNVRRIVSQVPETKQVDHLLTVEGAAYCYQYPDAKKPGDKINKAPVQIPYYDLTESQANRADANKGWTEVDGKLTACWSPKLQADALNTDGLSNIPSGYWNISGVEQSHLDSAWGYEG